MKLFKGFENRQYQLHICCNKKYKHRSIKSREVSELFIGKIAYNYILFKNRSHYSIDNRQSIRRQIKLLKEHLNEDYE